ncbi:beta/gamma crystallin domain-containing protein [Streptomyces sp. NPDC088785]|uniref:beta/gamma crystallin domain-containing protein n=1 Tax=Streptomyces sp. NPDC088785 TaxID=3365897 RepID=UPI0037FAE82B
MILKGKKAIGALAAAVAVAATLTVGVPSPAFAIDHVQCVGGENFLKIYSHLNGRDSVDCYANAGRTDFGGWWVDRIVTGNNDLIYYDANGDSVRIDRWHDISFPNNPPRVASIQIL